MELIAIIGLLSSLVTIEEATRSIGKDVQKKSKEARAKKTLTFKEWDSEDECVQRAIDAFKNDVRGEYKEHIFSEEEIESIADAFLYEHKDLQIDYEQKKEVREFISRTLSNYNDYNRKQMTVGEAAIYDLEERNAEKINEVSKKIDATYEMVDSEKNNYFTIFLQKVKTSKTTGLSTIEDKINGEYEIDRSDLINKIRKDRSRFISIQGNAGSGKSSLCKTLVRDEEYLLFARAEELVHVEYANDVWDCNLEKVFQELSKSGHRVVLFIDALEFIADFNGERFRVLQELYSLADMYTCVTIVTTCRTADCNAFLRLYTKYEVKVYEVGDVTDEELKEIEKRYPVIKELSDQRSYSELLKSPFYINFVIANGITSADISDENVLRKYIWDNIICLNKKSKLYGVDSSEVRNTIKKIVFERARKFLLGIHKDEINSSILHALESEGIISAANERIRLKYDVFEDICFEQYIDIAFDESRGNLSAFFSTISSLGECVYRRYQIWISNKLIIKQNRDKFLYHILFQGNVPEEWKKQTEIGIVKSNHCYELFSEYAAELRENALLAEFISIINLYAFEARLEKSNNGNQRLKLIPVGKAREYMIHHIYDYNTYKTDELSRASVTKLCFNLACTYNINENVASEACKIIQYYADEKIKDRSEGWYYSSVEGLSSYLTVLYLLSKYAQDWLKNFFNLLTKMYLSESEDECRWASDISVWTFEHPYPALTQHLGEELCLLADTVFFEKDLEQERYYGVTYEKEQEFGLSDIASSITIGNRKGLKTFLDNLTCTNLDVSVKWIIRFINKAVDYYVRHFPEDVINITVYFPEEKQSRQYWGNGDMWVCSTKEYYLPTIVSDIVYYTKKALVKLIEYYIEDTKIIVRLAEWIKTEIYHNSNNIVPFLLIEELGFYFQDIIPGYALELASSFELLHFDISKYSLCNPNSASRILEKQIYQAFRMPELKNKYQLDPKCNLNLQQYVSRIQLLPNQIQKEKAEAIIEYLYDLIEKGVYEPELKFQAQKMDMRNPTIKPLGNGYYEITATIPENEKAKQPHSDESKREIIDISNEIEIVIKNASKGIENTDFASINKLIDELINTAESDDAFRIQNENNMVVLIALALSDKQIDNERRDDLMSIWLNGIDRFFANGSFVADLEWTPILFKQLDFDVSEKTSARIKKIIINSITYNGENGRIDLIADYALQYLATNEVIARSVFNTIIKLAEDNCLTKCESKRDCIIEQYLIKETPLELGQFEISKYDINMLCYISNCGLPLTDMNCANVMRQIVLFLIDLWQKHERRYETHSIVGYREEYRVKKMFQRELLLGDDAFEAVMSILFNDIDFTKFCNNTIDFYLDIFEILISKYFDAYNDDVLRKAIEKRILCLEDKINKINDSYVRTQLIKPASLVLSHFYDDWNKCTTSYSNKDKRFLNKQYSKYAKYHKSDFLRTIYMMHIDELLPEILLSVNTALFLDQKTSLEYYLEDIEDNQWILEKIILDAFVYYSDEIKCDEELSNAYTNILRVLIQSDNEKAAVLLDEFLIH